VSTESCEAAVRDAVETVAATVGELRIAEVTRQDVAIQNGQVTAYRVRTFAEAAHDGDVGIFETRRPEGG
jgi:dodecin